MKKEQLQQRIEESKTSVFKVVFPGTTNHYNTLFGGVAMQNMDEVAFIAGTRFCRKNLVTVSSSQIDFNKAIPADTIVEFHAEVIEVGNTSLKVKVEVFKENMFDRHRTKSIEGVFTMVAVDENKKPVKILD
ncbi:MAG: acyl-CoA thioesterase [Weeksellaceae bacterium]